MKDKTVLAVVIVAILIVGGIIGGIIINNRMALDRQVKLQAREEKQKAEAESKRESEELMKTVARNGCLQRADDYYWEYIKLNATSTKQGADGPVYTAYQATWDIAESTRKNAKDECFRN